MVQPAQARRVSDSSIVSMTMPVSERQRSIPVRVVEGCPYNKCKFCIFYHETKDGPKDFAVKLLADVKRDILDTRDTYASLVFHHKNGLIESVFMGDGDVMAMPTSHFLELLGFMRENIPGLQRVTGYARAKGIIARKDDLAALREAGLTDLYVGFESGSGLLLKLNNKDATVLDNLHAAEHLNKAGIGINAMVISGLGGAVHSGQHAIATATMLNSMHPDTVIMTRFTISAQYAQMIKYGVFKPATDEQIVLEELAMVERLQAARRFFISSGIACCGDYFEADSKPKLIDELQRVLQLVRAGERLMHIYNSCGG